MCPACLETHGGRHPRSPILTPRNRHIDGWRPSILTMGNDLDLGSPTNPVLGSSSSPSESRGAPVRIGSIHRMCEGPGAVVHDVRGEECSTCAQYSNAWPSSLARPPLNPRPDISDGDFVADPAHNNARATQRCQPYRRPDARRSGATDHHHRMSLGALRLSLLGILRGPLQFRKRKAERTLVSTSPASQTPCTAARRTPQTARLHGRGKWYHR